MTTQRTVPSASQRVPRSSTLLLDTCWTAKSVSPVKLLEKRTILRLRKGGNPLMRPEIAIPVSDDQSA